MTHNEGFLLGQRHFLRGEYGRSIMGFGKALESGMDPTRIHLPLGLAYLKNSDFAEAATEFTQALELDPTNDQLLFLRGMARFNRGELKGALEDLNEALRYNSYRSTTYVARSLLYRAQHREHEAELDMKAALSIGGVEAELFMREYCLAPSLHNLALSLLDVDKATWGVELKYSGSPLTH
ncbi:MAG: tetratricopeptide repeat protein [Desulfobulbus sp.]|nr:tetratricopeptide repeat protein [Desulfobulbus sp.]